MKTVLKVTKRWIKAYIDAYAKVMKPLYENGICPLPL